MALVNSRVGVQLAEVSVRLRTLVTKGPAPRQRRLTFVLIDQAQARWRAVNPPNLAALVRAGATFRWQCVERTRRPGSTRGEPKAASKPTAFGQCQGGSQDGFKWIQC